jgi:hypothetical protein
MSRIKMKPHKYFILAVSWFLVAGLVLGACGAPTLSVRTVPTKALTATPPPITPPQPTSTPTVAPTPLLAGGSVQAYHNKEGDLALLLPAGWAVSEPQQTPLGSVYELGPAPLAVGDPSNSALVVADARAVSIEQALDLLCDGECILPPELSDAVVGGSEARLVHVQRAGKPPLEWVFVQYGGKLIYFSIHHPDTLEPLDGVIQTFNSGELPAGMEATLPGVRAARAAMARELDVDPYTIVLLNADAIDFADACLGAPARGEVCAQVLTPGYIGYLQTRTLQYEFRVDETDRNVRLIPGAALSARQILAQQLRVNLDGIVILSAERVQWSNSCLGAPTEGEACAEAVTPGYRVVLEAGGLHYIYHTDEAGSAVRLAAAPTLEIKQVTVVWEGAGVYPCTTLMVGRAALAFGPCGGILMPSSFVSHSRVDDLAYFSRTYAPFEAETPAGKVNFIGQGAVRATPAEQRMIAEWAHWVSVEAAAGRGGASWGLAFAWHREGGIAGFCDDLAVYVTGEVFATSCKSGQPDDLGRGYLTAAQLGQVYAWLDSLTTFELEHTDPATADAMTVRLVFSGTGSAEPTEADQQAIQDLAAELFGLFANLTVKTDVRYVLTLQDVTMYGPLRQMT